MTFFGWKVSEDLVGVMGMEPIKDVTLIRHAYVLQQWQQQGIGGKILSYIKSLVTTSRLLVGMWSDAHWAMNFYKKHGFIMMPDKDRLLETYWDISRRQIDTSVVLGIEIKRDEKERDE